MQVLSDLRLEFGPLGWRDADVDVDVDVVVLAGGLWT